MDAQYQPRLVEAEAQSFWEANKCFEVDEDTSK